MDATSNQFNASSSSLPIWDVFLSFCGKDTRGNFVANLYFALVQAGIQTFKDDPALEKGEEITSGLLNAIKNSNMFIVVLSENYASSRWCLDELVEILSCKRKNGQVVIPVFYYVRPSDVRHQKGSFGEALHSLNNCHFEDKVDKWKSALAEIAELNGYRLKKDADENESDTIQKIVENLAPQASAKTLDLEECLFGIDYAVGEIYQMLRMKSNDVRAIGIYGMGGIGKTTTAKAFYNKYSNTFDVSCFVDNIKQKSQGGSDLLPLLEQLLGDLLRRKDFKVPDVNSGMRQLKRILCFKKALIIFDDLDQSSYSQFLVRFRNLFSAGSRIIITTRDANLLNQLKVDIPEVEMYMVKKLGQTDSLELFSYHAFGKLIPPESFRDLSACFVTYAGGLPLALKVLGSSLRGRTHVTQVPFWKAKLKKVREIPENQIQKILQLSYDDLCDDTEKAIFLNIVFFFIGKDKSEAVHVFESCDLYPEAGIPVLVERCLLTIDEGNKFQMDNLIQDMGREVIREESKHGKCTRFMYLCQGNAYDALQNLEGTDKVEGLILDLTMSTKRQLNAKIFEKLPNLKFLEVIYARDIRGNFKNSFHELRCIRWPYCPWTSLPSDFRPRKLVSLDMPFSELKTLWKGAMPLVSLKIINVSYSKKLKTTLDFKDLKLLEKLLLRGCKGLLNVHPSIGQLTNLGHLDLGECGHLKELPEPIGKLTNLGHLDLRDCHRMKRLPELIVQLTNLSRLDLGGCQNLNRLPDKLGDMKGLKVLDVSCTAIVELSDSIAQLKRLVKLYLFSCEKLRKLPEQIGSIEGLRTFDASCSAIERLPDSFGSLINLTDMRLSYCKNLTSLPNSLGKLKSLEVLDLHNCSKLERLPEQFGGLQSLELLTVSGTLIQGVPYIIQQLSSLQQAEY